MQKLMLNKSINKKKENKLEIILLNNVYVIK